MDWIMNYLIAHPLLCLSKRQAVKIKPLRTVSEAQTPESVK